jgi:hypothetical protein
MHDRSCYSVTEALALIIVIMIGISAIGFIIMWGMPFIDQKKTTVRADSALIQFKIIGDTIQDVADKGINGSSIVDFVTDMGQVSIEPGGDRFIFYYSLVDGFDFNVSGLDEKSCTTFSLEHTFGSNPDSIDIYHLNSGETFPGVIGIIDEEHTDCGAPQPLLDAVKIDIKNITSVIIGQIWLFDSGSMYYQMYSGSDYYVVTAENGGVLSASSGSRYVASEPNIYNEKGMLVMKIIQLKPGKIAGSAGEGTHTFIIKSNGSYVREIGSNISGGFKMQIYGNYNISWIDYFKSTHDFIQFGGTDILYLKGKRDFTLVHSICEITRMV